MGVDIQTFQPRPTDDAQALELVSECRSRLGGEWTLVSASIKLTKSIFEADYNGLRVIGKASTSKRSKAAYEHLQQLYPAGMKPPSKFTVPKPIAWFDDLGLLVLEKAPGASILEILQEPPSAIEPAIRAAQWLHTLNGLRIDAHEALFDVAVAERRSQELAERISDQNFSEITSAVISTLRTRPSTMVPTHGDYHPMNLYVAPERVTAIDLDTFALRDPESDIGYFLAQTANFGLRMFDSFDSTQLVRERFRASFPKADERRVSAHFAWAFNAHGRGVRGRRDVPA
jgi:hypothetical protein